MQPLSQIRARTERPSVSVGWVRWWVSLCVFLVGPRGVVGAATIAAGALDPTFQPGIVRQTEVNGRAMGTVQTIVCLPDGRILIGGRFDHAGGAERHNLARLLANGSADPTFDAGDGPAAREPTPTSIRTILPTTGGKLYVGGGFTTYDLITWPCLVRVGPNGSLDATFDAGDFDPVFAATPASVNALAWNENRLIVGGLFKGQQKPGADRRQYNLQVLDSQGLIQNNFANGNYPIEGYNAILPLPDGNIVVGSGTTLTFLDDHGDLLLDEPSRFIPSKGGVEHLVLQPDNKIIVAGSYLREIHGVAVPGLARLRPNGLLDPGFQPATITSTANRLIRAVALQPDGKILVGGLFDRVGGLRRYSIARLHPHGAVDETFDSREVSDVTAIALQPDGKILVGVTFNYDTTDAYYQQSQGPIGIKRLLNSVSPVGPLVQPKFDPISYDESCLTASMRSAVVQFERDVLAQNGRITKTSACRSQAYQDHLYEIWSHAEKLRTTSGVRVLSTAPLQLAALAGSIVSESVIFELNEEIRSHWPGTFPPIVAQRSPHSAGIAIDWSISGITDSEIDDIADATGLVRNVPGEPWHLALTSASSRKRCVFRGNSPIALLVQDPLGRRVGYDPISGSVINEIGPAVFYSGFDSYPQEIIIPAGTSVPGAYRISGVGTGTGPYTVEVEVLTEDDSGDHFAAVLATGTASAGRPLNAIPPVDCFARSARLHYRRVGSDLRITLPDWATNGAVDVSTALLPGAWRPWPQPPDSKRSVLVPISGEHAQYFRLGFP